jgi:hypothetical protein
LSYYDCLSGINDAIPNIATKFVNEKENQETQAQQRFIPDGSEHNAKIS